MVGVGGLFLVETGYDTSLSMLDADSIKRQLDEKCYVEERHEEIHAFAGEGEERTEENSGFTGSCATSSRSSTKLALIEKTACKAEGMQQADSAWYSLEAGATLLDTWKTLNYTCTNMQMHSERSPAGQFRAFFKCSRAAVV